jgi:hypothetical protein
MKTKRRKERKMKKTENQKINRNRQNNEVPKKNITYEKTEVRNSRKFPIIVKDQNTHNMR